MECLLKTAYTVGQHPASSSTTKIAAALSPVSTKHPVRQRARPQVEEALQQAAQPRHRLLLLPLPVLLLPV
jgi:hypothetical protein